MAILLRLDFFELLQAGVKLSLKFLCRFPLSDDRFPLSVNRFGLISIVLV